MSIRERNILIAVGPYSLCLGEGLFLICHELRLSDIVVRGARRVSARSRLAGEFRKLVGCILLLLEWHRAPAR
jgi:hypothetical protein